MLIAAISGLEISVIIVTVLIVAFGIGITIYRRRHGKNDCGCDCAGCSGNCHSKSCPSSDPQLKKVDEALKKLQEERRRQDTENASK